MTVITANNANMEFVLKNDDLFIFRKQIAREYDQEIGDLFAATDKCTTNEDYELFTKIAEDLSADPKYTREDCELIDFLFELNGSISYRTCRKLHGILAKAGISPQQKFMTFLSECYSRRRSMRWFKGKENQCLKTHKTRY